MSKDYVILFDGLVEPVNPGGHGCYGYVIWRSKNKSCNRGYLGCEPSMTNNKAEWMAIINALKEVLDKDDLENIHSILILGDSKLVVNQITDRWKTKSESMRSFKEEALSLLNKINVPWYAHWIPRNLNEEADKLGREAYNLEMAYKSMEEN